MSKPEGRNWSVILEVVQILYLRVAFGYESRSMAD